MLKHHKMTMLSLTVSYLIWGIIMVLDEPFISINMEGLVMFTGSIITILIDLKFIIHLVVDGRKSHNLNLGYLSWGFLVLLLLLQLPYYYVKDIMRGYNVMEDGIGELWQNARCFFWEDEKCLRERGHEKLCVKFQRDGKCERCEDKYFRYTSKDCEGAK